MKTKEEIDNKISEMEEYLSEHYNKCYEVSLAVLKQIPLSTQEDIIKYHDYLVDKVAPIETFEQRQELKKKQEEYYNKHVKPVSHSSKKYKEVFEKWCSMDVPDYDEYQWGAYHTMRWLFNEKDAEGNEYL